MIKHTDHCTKHRADYEARKAEYEKLWPNYCRECHGWGVVQYQENLGPMGKVWLCTQTEPCAGCGEKGVCARCGDELPEDYWEKERPCPACGWNWGHNKGDVLGEPPECFCYYELGELENE